MVLPDGGPCRAPFIKLIDETTTGEIVIGRPRGPIQPEKTGPRVNNDITARKVRLVDADGEMVGVVSIRDAVDTAVKAGLDLVEVSPNADPPVCKVLDYGKYKYEQQKKANEARKKQKTVEVKELKMRPGIDDHDYMTKMKKAYKFLEDGNKIKFTIRFRGRELAHKDKGMDVLKRISAELEEQAKIELRPKMEGRQMIMIVGPR
ncbi:MAG: translation initiation factor IF-3 [Alphaproteobacteria bacterium]